MTRDEQIIETSHNYGKTLNEEASFDYEDMKCAFKNGAKWADEHPNLESIWHDASEEPLLEDKEIIFLNEQDIAYISERFGGTFSFMLEDFNWERFVNLLKISRWAYISDLLPKGGAK